MLGHYIVILSCDVSLTFCIRHCHIKRDDCLSTFYSTIFVTLLWYLSHTLSCYYWGLLLPILQNGKFLKAWDQSYTNSLSSRHLVQGKYSINVSKCMNSTRQKKKKKEFTVIYIPDCLLCFSLAITFSCTNLSVTIGPLPWHILFWYNLYWLVCHPISSVSYIS